MLNGIRMPQKRRAILVEQIACRTPPLRGAISLFLWPWGDAFSLQQRDVVLEFEHNALVVRVDEIGRLPRLPYERVAMVHASLPNRQQRRAFIHEHRLDDLVDHRDE